MKFEYEIDKKNLKKILKINHFKIDLIYIIIFSIFYFMVNAYAMKFNFLLVFVSYLIYLLLFILVILLINLIYDSLYIKKNRKNILGKYIYEINDKEIIENYNNKKYITKKSDINEINKTKNKIIIKTKNKYKITFYKFLIKDFEKLNNILTED